MQPFQSIKNSLVFIVWELPVYAVPCLAFSSEECVLHRPDGFLERLYGIQVHIIIVRAVLGGKPRRGVEWHMHGGIRVGHGPRIRRTPILGLEKWA